MYSALYAWLRRRHLKEFGTPPRVQGACVIVIYRDDDDARVCSNGSEPMSTPIPIIVQNGCRFLCSTEHCIHAFLPPNSSNALSTSLLLQALR